MEKINYLQRRVVFLENELYELTSSEEDKQVEDKLNKDLEGVWSNHSDSQINILEQSP